MASAHVSAFTTRLCPTSNTLKSCCCLLANFKGVVGRYNVYVRQQNIVFLYHPKNAICPNSSHTCIATDWSVFYSIIFVWFRAGRSAFNCIVHVVIFCWNLHIKCEWLVCFLYFSFCFGRWTGKSYRYTSTATGWCVFCCIVCFTFVVLFGINDGSDWPVCYNMVSSVVLLFWLIDGRRVAKILCGTRSTPLRSHRKRKRW